jgi:adenylate kinase family enzyme
MIINIVASPCAGKSTLACSLFAKMKTGHLDVEYVSEYAKQLVWEKNYDLLNNQYYVASHQYKMIKSISDQVEYLVCDSPLFMSLLYNDYNLNNVSNVDKTRDMILKRMSEFKDSVYIFIKRDREISYNIVGRIHSEDESYVIEKLIKKLLDKMKIKYFTMTTGEETSKVYDYIMANKTKSI